MCIGKFEVEGSVQIVGAVPSLSRRRRMRSSRKSGRQMKKPISLFFFFIFAALIFVITMTLTITNTKS